jgi:hypothetical protein
VRPLPSHALSDAERAVLVRVANEPRFAAVPPARIVPLHGLGSTDSPRRRQRCQESYGQQQLGHKFSPITAVGLGAVHSIVSPFQQRALRILRSVEATPYRHGHALRS